MFNKLSQAISKTVQSFGQKQLSPAVIDQCCHDIRMTLLDADVAQEAANHFLDVVRQKAGSAQLIKNVTQQNQLFSIIHEALTDTLGSDQTSPIVPLHGTFMLAGLQGSGKTTTAAKLAHWLKREHKKTVALTSVDFQRPAAIDQLETLAKQIDAPFIRLSATDNIKKVIETESLRHHADITIVDTAGRVTIDHEMMGELKTIHTMLNPIESLFVVDALTGQDAANVAKEFHDLINLSGVVLSKTDGDSRGGAALSVKTVTGKPIKFIGTGEKIDAFDVFDAERIASRILDLGDIAALVKKMQDTVDEDKAQKMSKKIKKGDFDFDDFLEQLSQLKKMGGLSQIMSMLPGTQNIPEQLKSAMDDDHFKSIEAMISSMTPKERRHPLLVKQRSRKKRIIKGAGIKSDKEFDQFMKQFEKMQKMLKKFSGSKMQSMMNRLGGKMPGGLSSLGFPPFGNSTDK